MVPGVPDTSNESRLTIGPKALKDLIEHFPVAKVNRSDPQLVWTFDDTEVGLKSLESSIDSRGIYSSLIFNLIDIFIINYNRKRSTFDGIDY